MRKFCWFITAPAAFVFVIIAFSSCRNSSANLEQPPPPEYAPPVVQPLKLSKPVKINLDSIKAVRVHPVIKPFDLDKLPAQSYDTAGFKPFKYPVEEAKFDYNALPEKDLDIDKLPSHPLKFKTYILPPPKLMKGAKPELKNGNLYLFGFGGDQGSQRKDPRCLFTDHEGFLWIATTTGLYRYDGENLLLILSYDKEEYTYGMVQDNLGNIWLSGYDGGIAVLDLKDGILKRLGGGQGVSGLRAFSFTMDKQQRIWVTLIDGGINIIDLKTRTIKLLDKAHGLFTSAEAERIMRDKNDNIWIGTRGGGINIVDLKNKRIRHLDKINGLRSDSVGSIIYDHKGRIWLAMYGGTVNVVDLQKDSIQTINEAQLPLHTVFWSLLLQDNEGKIWIGVDGLTIIDPDKRTVKYLKENNGLVSHFLSSIIQDSRGQVWIGTPYGLNMVSNNNAVIDHIGKEYVAGLTEDQQGYIWQTALGHGVDILNQKKETSRHLGVKEGLATDNTNDIKAINRSIIISTDSGLEIVDTGRKTITYMGGKQGLDSNTTATYSINDFTADEAGRLWIGEYFGGGLEVYDPQNKTLKRLGKVPWLIDKNIYNTCIDKQGQIWVSTRSGGIDRIDPKAGTIQYLNNVPALKDEAVLFPDDEGNIWMGTYEGIYIADIKHDKLVFLSTSQGAINEKILSLLQHNGRIYAGTSRKRIMVIKPPAEGVSSNKKWEVGFSSMAYNNYNNPMITKDGLYWSGEVGINVLDLSKKDTFKSSPYITGINVYDYPMYFTDRERFNSSITDTLWELNEEKHYLKDEALLSTSYALQSGLNWDGVTGPGNMPVDLTIPYDQNLIRFNYSSFNLTPHDSTLYRYVLIGKDKKWSDITGDGSTINYMNLKPGKYTFEVISREADNVWSQPAKFSFTINPPWWQTWWAYTIYVVVFFGTIWGFVTLRSRQLVKEKRILEHKVHVRTEEVIQQKEEIEAQRDNLEKSFKELKNAQTQLIQSEKMASLGELTAGIAHEIQNPLNFVNNFSEVNTELIDELQQGIDNGNYDEVKAIAGDIKENQQKISQHGKRADFIVKGMLLHSRNNSGERQLTNINVLADEFFKLSYHGLRAKDKSFNAEMTTHFGENLPAITVVQQDIGRVLLNLFNNAFYATNQKAKTAGAFYKPEVLVSTTSENGQVIIKVKDNGVGIPDTIKEKIMQPFFTTKPTGEGTGLGLSLTYDMVVKGHGGSIQVNSKEGEGSEFIISLPV